MMSPMAIIDSHYHLDRETLPVPDLIAAMERAGIERTALIAAMSEAVVFSAVKQPLLLGFRIMLSSPTDTSAHQAGLFFYRNAVERDGTVEILGDGYAIKAQPRNDEVLEAVKAHPNRFFGWIFVNPVGPVDPIEEIERCRQTPGMIGVKAHPYWHNYPVERLAAVADRCRQLDLPLLVHLGPDAGGDFKLLPGLFPELRIVYAHAGTPYLRNVCAFAAGQKNIFVDLARPDYVDLRSARIALALAGPDKCIFGTDGPYSYRGSFADFGPSLRILGGLKLNNRDREKVAGENFLRLIGK